MAFPKAGIRKESELVAPGDESSTALQFVHEMHEMMVDTQLEQDLVIAEAT